jgi:hypothetical protein
MAQGAPCGPPILLTGGFSGGVVEEPQGAAQSFAFQKLCGF